MARSNSSSSGFTVIEVIIVVAIAALILVVVFVAVPTLQRSVRNTQRKRIVDAVAVQLSQAAGSNAQGRYPGATLNIAQQEMEQCQFIVRYLDAALGRPTPSVSCPISATGGDQQCVFITFARYNVCFRNFVNAPHDYQGDLEEIAIQLGHQCADITASATTEFPITDTAVSHDVNQYVVWTLLENGPIYCVDNS